MPTPRHSTTITTGDFDLLLSHRLLDLNANTMLESVFLPFLGEGPGRFLYYYHGIF